MQHEDDGSIEAEEVGHVQGVGLVEEQLLLRVDEVEVLGVTVVEEGNGEVAPHNHLVQGSVNRQPDGPVQFAEVQLTVNVPDEPVFLGVVQVRHQIGVGVGGILDVEKRCYRW